MTPLAAEPQQALAVQGPAPSVSVIIAARDAAATIARAVGSALEEPETLEVLVVDDASRDGTAAAARACDPGGGRVRVFELARNLGPGGARNFALDAAQGAYVTILDADDLMLPGRLAQLLSQMGEADIIADDLCLSESATPLQIQGRLLDLEAPMDLTLEGFALGNALTRGARPREMGFLKPLIRREFLETHGLRYDPDLRLGEDFVLYARALATGARFRLTPALGYVAVRHADSLSRKHRTEDLQAFLAACRRLADAQPALGPARRALEVQALNVARRYAHRQLLDVRQAEGLRGVLAWVWSNWRLAPHVAGQILMDKLGRS